MKYFLLIWLTVISSMSIAMEWQWLEDMRLAVQQQTYRGEFLYVKGSDTHAYSIEHLYDGVKSKELLRQLQGPQVEVIRDGNKLICYFPLGAEQAIEHPIPTAPFSLVGAFDLMLISQHYTAQLMDDARVAGYEARVIELVADEWRYRHRFWLEKSTNMLLKAELRSFDGTLLEQFRFLRLELAASISADQLVPAVGDSATVISSIMEVDMTKAERVLGTLHWLPAGFSLVHSSNRTTDDGWIETQVFSDGLVSFSVYLEKNAHLEDYQSSVGTMGATTAFMTMYDNLSLTVIGELPSKTARQLAQNITVEQKF